MQLYVFFLQLQLLSSRVLAIYSWAGRGVMGVGLARWEGIFTSYEDRAVT